MVRLLLMWLILPFLVKLLILHSHLSSVVWFDVVIVIGIVVLVCLPLIFRTLTEFRHLHLLLSGRYLRSWLVESDWFPWFDVSIEIQRFLVWNKSTLLILIIGDLLLLFLRFLVSFLLIVIVWLILICVHVVLVLIIGRLGWWVRFLKWGIYVKWLSTYVHLAKVFANGCLYFIWFCGLELFDFEEWTPLWFICCHLFSRHSLLMPLSHSLKCSRELGRFVETFEFTLWNFPSHHWCLGRIDPLVVTSTFGLWLIGIVLFTPFDGLLFAAKRHLFWLSWQIRTDESWVIIFLIFVIVISELCLTSFLS